MLPALPSWLLHNRSLLGFFLGAITPMAFAPFEQGWLALLSIAALLQILWRADNAAASARIGYAFGLGLLGFGVFWLRISIGQFGGVVPALAIASTLLFIAFVALYFAVFGWLIHRLGHRLGRLGYMLVAAPVLWLLLEWLKSWLFTGFPWLSIAYSQLDLPLAGYLPILGIFGVSGLLVLSAGLLNLWNRPWAWLVLLTIWLSGWVLTGVTWTEPRGEPIQVAVVQGNVAQQDKWRPHLFAKHLRLYQDLTEQATEAQLVVWPETAIAAFDRDIAESVLQPLHQRMQEQGRDLLSGIVMRGEQGRYYNAMLSFGVSGQDHYHKRHLVPFGEYLPFRSLLGPVLDFLHIPMSDFSVGDDRKPLIELAGHAVGINICYEDAFATEVLRALPEAGFLINASNDAWFGDSLAPHQHLQIARARALESGRYLLRATNTGISASIDHHGQIRSWAPQFKQAVLTDSVQPMQGITPYARWGDWPVIVLASLLFLAALYWRPT